VQERDILSLSHAHAASQEGFGVGEGLGFMTFGGEEE